MKTSQQLIQQLLQFSHTLQVRSNQAIKEAEFILLQEQNAVYISGNWGWLVTLN